MKNKIEKQNYFAPDGIRTATTPDQIKWSIHYTTNATLSLPIEHSILTAVR